MGSLGRRLGRALRGDADARGVPSVVAARRARWTRGRHRAPPRRPNSRGGEALRGHHRRFGAPTVVLSLLKSQGERAGRARGDRARGRARGVASRQRGPEAGRRGDSPRSSNASRARTGISPSTPRKASVGKQPRIGRGPRRPPPRARIGRGRQDEGLAGLTRVAAGAVSLVGVFAIAPRSRLSPRSSDARRAGPRREVRAVVRPPFVRPVDPPVVGRFVRGASVRGALARGSVRRSAGLGQAPTFSRRRRQPSAASPARPFPARGADQTVGPRRGRGCGRRGASGRARGGDAARRPAVARVDCLDRTNVAQFAFGLAALGAQLGRSARRATRTGARSTPTARSRRRSRRCTGRWERARPAVRRERGARQGGGDEGRRREVAGAKRRRKKK